MSGSVEKLLILHGKMPDGEVWLSFLEPDNTVAASLCERVVQRRYDKPFLIDTHHTRSLCFEIDGPVQSEMRLDAPDQLVCAYTRKMMGFMLLRLRPRRLLMLGLGGGSLVKYCHRHLPSTRVTVVEIDPQVIALRSYFDIPVDDSRLSIVNADGAAHVAAMAQANEHTNVMLVDAFDREGLAAAVMTRKFLDDARSALSPRGVFVMNLVGEDAEVARMVRRIRSAFGDPVIAITVKPEGNIVVFAGEALRDKQLLHEVPKNARHIEGSLGLSFPTLLGRTQDCLYQDHPAADSG